MLIESNSLIVVTAIRMAHTDNWRLEYELRDCLKLYSPDFEIVHGYRQKNVVADRLATWAYSHRLRQDFFRVQDLPIMVRTWYFADRLQLRNFRP